MTQKEYHEALGRLSDQYMFDETMTNAEYLRKKNLIETTYLKTIYKKKMKLFTKEILKKLPALYTQIAHDNPEEEMVFHVKLFTPDSNWTWFIAEYDPEKEIAWGYVMGHENEFGTIDIKELKEVRGPFGLPIERDISFDSIKEKQLMEEIERGVA